MSSISLLVLIVTLYINSEVFDVIACGDGDGDGDCEVDILSCDDCEVDGFYW